MIQRFSGGKLVELLGVRFQSDKQGGESFATACGQDIAMSFGNLFDQAVRPKHPQSPGDACRLAAAQGGVRRFAVKHRPKVAISKALDRELAAHHRFQMICDKLFHGVAFGKSLLL